MFRFKTHILTALLLLIISNASYCQKGYKDKELRIVKHRIDSLQKRIEQLDQLLSFTKNDLAKYHRMKDEIALSNFKLKYEQHYVTETLDQAKKLVSKKLSEAYRNDRADLVKVFEKYKKDITRRMKNQKLKYRALFQNEKMFKLYIQPYFKDNTIESQQQAVFICKLALRYAAEQRVVSAQEFITRYMGMGEAYLFDLESDYDLASLTKSEAKFNKIFRPLISTDDISKFQQAKILVEECIYFSERIDTKLSAPFYSSKIRLINSVLLDKEQELAVAGMANMSLVAKHAQPMDAVNDFGIFRFYDKIVVIGKFNPAVKGLNPLDENDFRIIKGMAIIKADVMLTTYIKRNIQEIKPNTKIISTGLIPYIIDGEQQWFFPINTSGEQQYRVTYTFIHSEKLTQILLQEHLQPIIFEEVD